MQLWYISRSGEGGLFASMASIVFRVASLSIALLSHRCDGYHAGQGTSELDYGYTRVSRSTGFTGSGRTHCPSGAHLDYQGRCVSDCPPGQYMDTFGQCLGCPAACSAPPQCPECKRWDSQTGQCVPCAGGCDPCPFPQIKNKITGQCHCPPDQIKNPNTGQCECPPGAVLNPETRRCEAACPPGTTKKPGTGQCECPSGTVYMPNLRQCLPQCPYGLTRNPLNGQCDCPPGMENMNGRCVLPCPRGALRNPYTGKCQCPPNTESIRGSCVPTCPPRQFRNSLGICEKPQCPPGTALGPNGKCVSKCPLCNICLECVDVQVTLRVRDCIKNHRDPYNCVNCLRGAGVSHRTARNLLSARSQPGFMELLDSTAEKTKK